MSFISHAVKGITHAVGGLFGGGGGGGGSAPAQAQPSQTVVVNRNNNSGSLFDLAQQAQQQGLQMVQSNPFTNQLFQMSNQMDNRMSGQHQSLSPVAPPDPAQLAAGIAADFFNRRMDAQQQFRF